MFSISPAAKTRSAASAALDGHAADAVDRCGQLLREAAQELFSHYEVGVHSANEPEQVLIRNADFVGVLGFSSDEGIRGTLTLAMDQKVLERSYPLEGSDYSDWLGELTNQLLGRFKNSLLRHGTTIYLSLPVVIGGNALSLATRQATIYRDAVLASDQGQIFMRMALSIAPGVVLTLQPTSDQPPLSEGKAMIF